MQELDGVDFNNDGGVRENWGRGQTKYHGPIGELLQNMYFKANCTMRGLVARL